ncbi:hypothetical protein JNUCC23_09070 [Peribacillus sp. JNUCC 23]
MEVAKESEILKTFTNDSLQFKDQLLDTGKSIHKIKETSHDMKWETVENANEEEFETVVEFEGRILKEEDKKILSVNSALKVSIS